MAVLLTLLTKLLLWLGAAVGAGGAELKDMLMSITSFLNSTGSSERVQSSARLGVRSQEADFEEACASHTSQGWSLGACTGDLRRLVATASIPAVTDAETLAAEAKQEEEVSTFVSAMFEVGEQQTDSPKEALKLCEASFEGDPGSIVRCLVRENFPKMALKEASRVLKAMLAEKSMPDHPSENRPTLALLSFARAYLTEQVGRGKKSEAAHTSDSIKLWTDFLRKAGQLHSYTHQLGLLMQHAASRLRELEPKHKAEIFLVRTSTVPQFFLSPLHPLKDTHLSVDVMKRGYWERETSALAASALLDVSSQSAECVFVDVGANVGWFTMMATSIGCRVVAYEPVADHCRQIRYALSASGLLGEEGGTPPRAVLHQAAVLSDPSKSLSVTTFAVGPAATSYVQSEDQSKPSENEEEESSKDRREATRAVRVDDTALAFLSTLPGGDADDFVRLHPLRAMKIDAEGCELEAFVSAERLLLPFAENGASGPPAPELFMELCPQLLHRCPGDPDKTLQRSAEIMEKVYSHWFVYEVHGHELHHPELFSTWRWRDISGISWKNWGSQGIPRIHKLRHGAKHFSRYVKDNFESNGCVYFWARNGEPLELSPIDGRTDL